MIQQESFARDEILPSWFMNRLQDRIAPLTNLRLDISSATTIRANAAANDEAMVVNVAGNWRKAEAAVTRAHPGGAAGTYLVFVTGKAQTIVNTPDPNTDNTDYTFALAIVPNATTPTIVAGTVDIFRRVGRLTWSGTAITALVQEAGAVMGAQLDDGVIVAGDVTATRQPGGGFLLDVAAGAITAAKVNAALKPSGGAAAGTEALRALGATASTAAAGDDARLADARTPLVGLQAGVIDAGDLKVVPGGSVGTLDAGSGFALVLDATANYLRRVLAGGAVTGMVAAAAAARIDSVYVNLSGVLVYITGTPGVGSTLDNRTGAPSLPPGVLHLCDVLRPASDNTIVAGNIRDRRARARGACAVVNLSTGTLLATTSTTLQEISASLSMRLELTGVPVSWEFRCQTFNTFGTANDAGPWIDGAVHPVASGGGKELYGTAVANVTGAVAARHTLTGLAAGSHLVSAGGNSGSGSGTANFLGDSIRPAQLAVCEILRPTATNS